MTDDEIREAARQAAREAAREALACRLEENCHDSVAHNVRAGQHDDVDAIKHALLGADAALAAAAPLIRAQCAEVAEAARASAIKALSDTSRALGEAEGKLAASEMAGVVDGWRTRALAAEAERDALRVVAEAARPLLAIIEEHFEPAKDAPLAAVMQSGWHLAELSSALDALPPGLGQSEG